MVANTSNYEPTIYKVENKGKPKTGIGLNPHNPFIAEPLQEPDLLPVTNETLVIPVNSTVNVTAKMPALNSSPVLILIIELASICFLGVLVPAYFLHCLFKWCLKKRVNPRTGRPRWVCRQATRKCLCFVRRPREINH